MKTKVILSAVLLSCFFIAYTANAEEIIIANKSVFIKELSINEIRDIFLGDKTRWDNGDRIIVVLQKKGPTHTSFVEKVIGKNISGFQTHWKKIIFTGSGSPPKIFPSESNVVEFIASRKGAIGYIDSSTPHDEVQLITLDNR